MEIRMNQSYTDKTVVFDGSGFIGCTFTDCVIIISSSDFHFERCSFYSTKFLIAPSLPIAEISHRLSQSHYQDIVCFWNDVYIDTETLSMIRQEMIS